MTGAAGRATGVHFQLFAASAAAPVFWRLLGGNNREMGRSAAGFPDPEACLMALKEVLAVVDVLSVRSRRTAPHEWVWEAFDGEAKVAAGHRFDRQIRCDLAARNFLELAPNALVGSTVMISGARRWSPHSPQSNIRSAPVPRVR